MGRTIKCLFCGAEFEEELEDCPVCGASGELLRIIEDVPSPAAAQPLSEQPKRMVKCLFCGAEFEEGPETCPVCGVGPDMFRYIDAPDAQSSKAATQKKYLILGGGAAAVSAAEAIRERDTTAPITLVYADSGVPYNRPMLTKQPFAQLTNAGIAMHDANWYTDNNIVLRADSTVAALDTAKKTVMLASGERVPYDTCIYALGSRSFVPPVPGVSLPQVVAIRTLADTERLAGLLQTAQRAVIIGGGVLGLETAWQIRRGGCGVTVIDTLPQLLAGKVAPRASALLERIAAQQGIRLRLGASVQAITGTERVEGVLLKDGSVLPADVVVMSAGVRANIEIAHAAGLPVERAVVVDAFMQVGGMPDVYACGDCAVYNGVNYSLWTQAAAQGKVAGVNAAGGAVQYQTPVPAITLSVMGTTLYAAGDNGAQPGKPYQTIEREDVGNGLASYWFLDGKLVGLTQVGGMERIAEAAALMERGASYEEIANQPF